MKDNFIEIENVKYKVLFVLEKEEYCYIAYLSKSNEVTFVKSSKNTNNLVYVNKKEKEAMNYILNKFNEDNLEGKNE